VDDRVQVCLAPRSILLDFLDFVLVRRLEDSVARNVIPLFAHILTHPPQNFLVADARCLQQPDKVVNGVVAVRTPVGLTNAGVAIAQDLLARVGSVSSTTTVHITTHVTVGMADVIFVLGVEFVVGFTLEGLAPEEDTLLQRETDTFQK